MPVRQIRQLAFLLLCLPWLHLGLAGHALALSCTFTITDIDFGDIELVNDTEFTTTGTLTADCSNGKKNQYLTICANIGDGDGGAASDGIRYLLTGSTQLEFNLYQESSHSTIWGSLDWSYSPEPKEWIIQEDGGGNVLATTTIYARIPPGQTTLPAGLYTSSFAGGSDVTVDYKQSKHGDKTCADAHSHPSGTENASFTVSANHTGTCTVSATDLDFGSTGGLPTSVDATNTLDVTCTGGMAYDIGLDGGESGATDPTQRKMSLGANEVTYGLYMDSDRTTAWGDTIGTDTYSGTGTGAVQTYTVYGRVPAQTSPPAGTYTDTIVVTITY